MYSLPIIVEASSGGGRHYSLARKERRLRLTTVEMWTTAVRSGLPLLAQGWTVPASVFLCSKRREMSESSYVTTEEQQMRPGDTHVHRKSPVATALERTTYIRGDSAMHIVYTTVVAATREAGPANLKLPSPPPFTLYIAFHSLQPRRRVGSHLGGRGGLSSKVKCESARNCLLR